MAVGRLGRVEARGSYGNPLGELRAATPPVEWELPSGAPGHAIAERVFVGYDAHGLGLEVAVAEWTGPAQPTIASLRALHASRLRRRAVSLCLIAYSGETAWLFGPSVDAPPLGPISVGEAARIAQAALDEQSGGAARARLLRTRDAIGSAEIPGLDSQGLFATHELIHGVPLRNDWPEACERAKAILETNSTGLDLIRRLGFETHGIPGNATLLTVGSAPPHALAILLRHDESFDAESARFAKSPIYHGAEMALQRRIPWLLVARGTELRLYPTSPDVGVSRRGLTQTFLGLDLALIADDKAGYLDLVFSAPALSPGGSVEQLLASSHDYAVRLGERLRQRVYTKVVDPLSTGVARQLARDAPLDEDRLDLAYRISLRILFRLLFQAYAEDSHLLPFRRNEQYTRAALKELAGDLARDPAHYDDPRSSSLWDGLIRVWRVIDTGDAAWGVPAYNGGLFGSDASLHPDGATIEALILTNDVVGPALKGLLVDETPDGWLGPVDFRSLDVRDFGTIYEGLLESGLSIADRDLVEAPSGEWIDASSADVATVRSGEPYFHTRAGTRRATGSYFTRPFVVEHLLDRALDPSLDGHLSRVAALLADGDEAEAAQLLFDFRVADLSMGSGHFLVAAVGHIESKFGAFLESNPLPGVERELQDLELAAKEALAEAGIEQPISRSALLSRQIARRCVYGVDLNEMTVELARLAIWVRTFVPGLPMSSLDHQLVQGDSLTGIGSVGDALKLLDPTTDDARPSFTTAAITGTLEAARRLLEDAAALKESTREEARASQEAARAAYAAAEPARRLFDAALAVRLGELAPPAAFDAEAVIAAASADVVREAVTALEPVHYPDRFPEVFLRDRPGFDVIVGNPPWEEVVVDEPRFWARHRPGLMARRVQQRDAEIDELRATRPALVRELDQERLRTDKLRSLLMSAFPLGRGDADLYKAFCWRFWRLTRPEGRIGVVLPKTAFSALGLEAWRREVLTHGLIEDLTILVNNRGWVFEGVHPQYSIGLAVIQVAGRDQLVQIAGGFASRDEYENAMAAVPARIDKDTLLSLTEAVSIPVISSQADADILAVMRRAPPLSEAFGGIARLVRELDATIDRRHFDHGEGPGRLPVYSGASFEIWNPDTGQVFAWADPHIVETELRRRLERQSRLVRSAFYGLEWDRDLGGVLPYRRARLAFRGITRPTDRRTSIAAVIPPGTVLTNIAPYVLMPVGYEAFEAYLCGVMNSVPFDWYARKFIETQMNFHFVRAFPVPGSPTDVRGARLIELVASLSALDARFDAWREGLGVETHSLSAEQRSAAVVEVDAIVALQYGLERVQLEHVFATFHRGWDYAERLSRTLDAYDHYAGRQG